MISKDIKAYASEHWEQCMETVTQISQDDQKHHPLVVDEHKMYNFDKITRLLLPTNKVGTSADGLRFNGQVIELVEFKSGFKQKITKQNFNAEQGECPKIKEICNDYWNQFFRRQAAERRILKDSIRIKALESYITIEKEVLPRCVDNEYQNRLKFIAVIDADEVDSMEDILAGLADTTPSADNSVDSLRQSLRRLLGRNGPDGAQYLYDDIDVMTAGEFEKYLCIQR